MSARRPPVNTNNIKFPIPAQTAGSGHIGEGSGCHSISAIDPILLAADLGFAAHRLKL